MNNYGFSDLCGSRNIICGLARSNEALISYLDKRGAEMFVSDKRKSEKEITDVLTAKGIKNAKIIKDGDFPKADHIFRTPAIRPDAPEILSATENGAKLTSEVELFFLVAKGKIFGITGSDGKTTTTTLVYEMLKRKLGENRAFIGGNIGIPLISFADNLTDESITVCELSSFQLMTLKRSPFRAAITNITENHLDYHRGMREYIDAKCNIFKGKDCKTLVIEQNALSYVADNLIDTGCETISFGVDGSKSDIFLDNGMITMRDDRVLDTSNITVRGDHNTKNFMTAIGMTQGIADKETFEAVARDFKGVAHRTEFIRIKDGISFYNSSIDSTPSRTIMTLRSLECDDLTVILGGYDKNLDFSELSRYIAQKRIKTVLIGENSAKIKDSLKANSADVDLIYRSSDISGAVEVAITVTKPGGCVILSPASASFDMFKDYECRGNVFKNIIKSL